MIHNHESDQIFTFLLSKFFRFYWKLFNCWFSCEHLAITIIITNLSIPIYLFQLFLMTNFIFFSFLQVYGCSELLTPLWATDVRFDDFNDVLRMLSNDRGDSFLNWIIWWYYLIVDHKLSFDFMWFSPEVARTSYKLFFHSTLKSSVNRSYYFE